MSARLWLECGARLVEKTLAELSFEGLVEPVADGTGWSLPLPTCTYTFTGRRSWFGSWVLDPGSVRRTVLGVLGDATAEPVHDVAKLLCDLAPEVGIAPDTLAGYIGETTATLAADVRLASTGLGVEDLADLVLGARGGIHTDGHLAGHPWLIANKGRVGFSAEDLARYAPEARTPLRLPWVAVHRGLAEFRAVPALSEDAVRLHQLGAETVAKFSAVLRERGCDPATYVWLPVHPWQLDHVVRTLWAPELGADRIVLLGDAPQPHLPTQSIRTMTPVEDDDRYQVKLPLRILNTAVWRGIPVHCSLAAPAVTQWLRGLWDTDPVLGTATLLGEVASVTVQHPHLRHVNGVPYTWTETLGCIWREPVGPTLAADEHAWPLAAVLHQAPDGADLLGELARRSGLGAAEWVCALLDVLLPPLLHLLYCYGITVNPHGENVMVVSDTEGRPLRVVLKDLVDDVNVSADPVAERGPEPDSHEHVLPRKQWPVLKQYLVDALLVGVLRPLAVLCEDVHGQNGALLWTAVREHVQRYAEANPDQTSRMSAGDLLAPRLPRYPLNADRLLQTGYGERAFRHSIAPCGTVPNPLAP